MLVSSEAIAPIMKQAIVAVEDKRFYEHNGVDLRVIVRALWQDIRSQSVVRAAPRSRSSTSRTPQPERADHRPQGARGSARVAADPDAFEGSDPHRAPHRIYFGNGAYGILQAARTISTAGL